MKFKKPFAWSFSRLSGFELCPRKLRETTITRRWSDVNKFNVAGTNDHEVVEKYAAGKGQLLPDMESWRPKIDRLLRIPGHISAELEICITENWKETGWFSKDAWARTKIDLNIFNPDKHTVTQLDWKTGKNRSDDRFLQLRTNNLLTDAVMKERGIRISKYNNGLVWVRQNFDIEPLIVKQDELPDIKDTVMEKVTEFQDAYNNDDFPPRRNYLCKHHCPVMDCEHNGRR